MEIFDDAHTKVTKRTEFIKSLASKLNGSFVNKIDELIYKFDLSELYTDLENSNAITGEIQGFEYCFIEYFHQGNGKYDPSGWVSNVHLHLNKDFPDFKLTTKKASRSKAISEFLLGIILIISIILFFILLFRNDNLDSFFSGSLLENLIVGVIMGAICIVIGFKAYMSMYEVSKTYITIKNQNKYNIQNPKFREKYVIFSESDENKISEIFNENAVSKFMATKPELTDINCHNKCLSLRFDNNGQLSFSLCNKYLGILLNQAKILENVE